ncbi:hypothetical protein OGAPHI_004506 [Ogataea philodendri]|uniref:Uncharacterized protein n=1 Tax=Ogataea philodendri TaxID=1378263 RepID=A0A9P8P6Q5_9ASCO|nr:uncharacterized protein OGAPHI_004506 [Ogataea philodendri]KAH3666317.1 hypothetical protein OGAPHI_004506 [Ogataea philodendri]
MQKPADLGSFIDCPVAFSIFLVPGEAKDNLLARHGLSYTHTTKPADIIIRASGGRNLHRLLNPDRVEICLHIGNVDPLQPAAFHHTDPLRDLFEILVKPHHVVADTDAFLVKVDDLEVCSVDASTESHVDLSLLEDLGQIHLHSLESLSLGFVDRQGPG